MINYTIEGKLWYSPMEESDRTGFTTQWVESLYDFENNIVYWLPSNLEKEFKHEKNINLLDFERRKREDKELRQVTREEFDRILADWKVKFL